MMELRDHPAYKRIETLRRDGMEVEFVVLQHAAPEHGLEEHRLAAEMAMRHISERWEVYVESTMEAHPKMRDKQFKHYHWDVELASAAAYPIERLLKKPDAPYYIDKPRKTSHSIDLGSEAEYAYAFLEPPYGNGFVLKDWEGLNALLFSAPENLEAYKWSDNWSNFFDDGKEWWGTFFWTVYDRKHEHFVVIAASSTD